MRLSIEESEVFVSVIIPVYNKAEFLSECLNSVLQQSLRKFEVICINDGSTDDSLSILRNFAQQDSRITVVNQDNFGAAASRNRGISLSQGDFLAFMDADDAFPSNTALERLYVSAIKQNVLICGGSFANFENGCPYECNIGFSDTFSGFVFCKEEVIHYVDYQFDFGYTRFIYKRSFILENAIEFPHYSHFEDPVFFVKAMLAARCFYAIPDVVYAYRIGHRSIQWTPQRVWDLIAGLTDILHISRENGLQKLHILTVRRLEEEYAHCIEPCLSEKRVFDKIMHANRAVDLDVLQDGFNKYHIVIDEGFALYPIFGALCRVEKAREELWASKSYRLGRALLFFPKKLKSIFEKILKQ